MRTAIEKKFNWRVIGIALLVLAHAVRTHAQGIPIGALPSATLPLSGSELTIISQNGVTSKATVNNVNAPGLTIANNTVLGNVSGGTASATGITASQVNALLGLGTAAFMNTGTSGSTIPILSNANTWSGMQTFNGGISLSSLTIGTLSVATITSPAALTIAPTSSATSITGTLTTSGALTVSAGGAAITGATSITGGSFTASGGAFTASPANANVVLSPTGTGVITINPATAGTINNVSLGVTTPLAAQVTTLTSTGQTSLGGAAAAEGVRVLNTASAVNRIQIQGAATSAPPALYSAGSDTNVNLVIATQGTGSINFQTNIASGVQQFAILNTASSNRYITVTGSNGGNPTLTTTAGSLAITPATVFGSTISATGITNTAGENFSGTTAPLSCNGAAGTLGMVLTSGGPGATCSWGAAPAYITWAGVKTTAFNAVSNTAYCVDTLTTGAVTMTLPASPADGDKVQFIDCKSNFSVANLTIARNTKTIMGLASDMTVNTTNATSILTYNLSTTDWRLN